MTEGLGKMKLKIKATYSSVLTKNSRSQNDNNNGGRNRGRGQRGDPLEDEYAEYTMEDTPYSTVGRNSNTAIFQPSTRGKYVHAMINSLFFCSRYS